MNYHTLSDFRVGQGELLDRLLAENVATLAACGLIDLDNLAQDGVRIRASAGATSYRRRATAGGASGARARGGGAAQARGRRRSGSQQPAHPRGAQTGSAGACREGGGALKTLGEVEAQRERRLKTNRKQTEKQKEPRASTTDPEVRIMKMADGGFRPAFNVQVVTVEAKQIVVAVEPSTVGSDRGLMQPMLEKSATASVGCRHAISPTAVCGSRRHRMGPRRRYHGLLSADQAQEWERSIPAARQ